MVWCRHLAQGSGAFPAGLNYFNALRDGFGMQHWAVFALFLFPRPL
jgi:hypothetical protein